MNPAVRRATMRATTVVAIAAVLTACGSVKENVEDRVARELVEEALGDGVELREDGYTVTDDDGRTIDVGSQSLPDAWPADLPVPSSGTIVTSIAEEREDGTEIAAMLEFTESLDEVRAEVESTLAGSSWTPDGEPSTMDAEGVRAWGQAYVSGENRTEVTVVDDGNGTTVSWQVQLAPGG